MYVYVYACIGVLTWLNDSEEPAEGSCMFCHSVKHQQHDSHLERGCMVTIESERRKQKEHKPKRYLFMGCLFLPMYKDGDMRKHQSKYLAVLFDCALNIY
jgi:hypothetical protein